MKKIALAIVTLFLLESISSASEAEYSGIVEILPGSVILGSDINDFKLNWEENNILLDEGITGKAVYAPSIGIGLDISSRYMKYQFIGGYSHIRNGEFSVSSVKFDVAALYAWNDYSKFSVGAHITSYTFVSPKWSGNTDIKFSNTNAIAPGMLMLFGDEFKIKASIDYLKGSSFAIETPVNVTKSQSSLSLDGYMFQLGVMYNFK